MTKSEFITALASELNQRKIADSDEILDKYRQHFAFKLADGYTEEEIAAKLAFRSVLLRSLSHPTRQSRAKGARPY